MKVLEMTIEVGYHLVTVPSIQDERNCYTVIDGYSQKILFLNSSSMIVKSLILNSIEVYDK